MKQTDALKEVHERALRRADEAWVFERENVRQGREDQQFYAGDQWDEAAKKARGTERPMLTVNRMGTFVRQITGDLRQNTPAIKVLPAGGPASQEKAEVLAGMIRSIEAKSDASACYVRGATNAAVSGQGAFRVLTRYCNEKDFDQELYIQQIADPFGVLIDPLAILPDKSDMQYGLVFERYSKESYKAKWPDAEAIDVTIMVNGTPANFEWMRGESVRVAEYWEREVTKAKLYLLADGTSSPTLPKGQKAVRSRDVDVVKIVSYMISGTDILEGPSEWGGKYIPICFIPGEEITIDGATKRKGIVRDAKDPQRLVNYARTTDAEQTALQPKAPYIVTVDQIKGYESIWRSAGTKNHPYLPFNRRDPTEPAPQRSPPPVMSSGLQNLSTQAGQDLHDVTGIYPASLGAKSNETSGVAIRARQHEGDTGSNYIPDNTRRAIAYCGRILVDLIPKIYDSERIVRILKEDGSHEMAAINAEQAPDDRPNLKTIDSLNDGEYDVVVSTGQSYLTRQEEMADTLVNLASTMPIIGVRAPDLLVKAMNFPGGDELADRLTPPEFKKDKQGNPLPPPPPDPEKVAEVRETIASADLKHAQAALALVQADQVASTLAGMGGQLKALTDLVKSLVSGAPQQPPAPLGPPDGGLGPASIQIAAPHGLAPALPPNGQDHGEIVDMHHGAPA